MAGRGGGADLGDCKWFENFGLYIMITWNPFHLLFDLEGLPKFILLVLFSIFIRIL